MNNNMNKIVTVGILVLLVLGVGGLVLSRSRRSSGVKASTQTSGTKNSVNIMPSQRTQIPQNSSTVQVTSTGYQPMNLTIKAGTTVTWINNSGTVVTVSSNDHPTHLLYPPLNLGKFSDGGQMSLTFDAPGTYGYHNHLNPSQTGTITVE